MKNMFRACSQPLSLSLIYCSAYMLNVKAFWGPRPQEQVQGMREFVFLGCIKIREPKKKKAF